MHVARFLALAAIAGCLLACPKRQTLPDPNVGTGHTNTTPPLPTEPQFKPKKDPAAEQALEQAISTADALPKEKAVEVFMQVRKAYPQTEAGQEALYRVGALYFDLGDHVAARRTFNELLFENPLHPRAPDAKLRLGLSALELGAYRDAYQTLISLADRAEGDDRRKLLEAASRAAEGAHLFAEALAIAIRQAEEAPPEEQEARLARVIELVEGKVAFIDLVRLHDGMSPSTPAWPILTFKLARIYYHLRDWPNLESTLRKFIDNAPGHPFAQQAQELLARANRRVETKPKTVGVTLPLSGRYKAVGEAVMRGVQLAMAGSDIELVVKDSQGEVNAGGRAVEELVFDNNAIAVLGPILGDVARRVALVSEELQVANLSLSRAERLTEIGPYIFRNMLTNSDQASALANYAVDTLGYKRFALLYPNIPYGVELANEFWDKVQAKGGEVRGAESYTHDQTTFTTEAKKLVGRYYLEDRQDFLDKAKEITEQEKDPFRRRKAMDKVRSTLEPVVDFEAVLIPDKWERVGLVAPALAVEDIITNACDPRDLERIKKTTGKKDLKTVTLLGTDQWGSPKDRDGVPQLIARGQKFVMCSRYVVGFFVDSERPAVKRFVKLYKDANGGREPGYFEAIGYDSARMIREIIDKKAPQTRAAFREELANLKDFEGATGTTSFGDRREALKNLFFLTIEPSGIREINPAEKVKGS